MSVSELDSSEGWKNGTTRTHMQQHLKVDQINLHMKKHLKPLVQQSAALSLASRELNEIDILSNNVTMLQDKVQQFIFDNENLDARTVDSLVKLMKEIRESLKYMLAFNKTRLYKKFL